MSKRITRRTAIKRKARVKKSHTSKNKSYTYRTLNNGAHAFTVHASPASNKIEITLPSGKSVLRTVYQRLFIGDNVLPDTQYAKSGTYPGNSILAQLDAKKYLFIGDEIYSFSLKDDTIVMYYSPVGNGMVPYPYAVGEHHTYFMSDKECVPNHLLDPKLDGYAQFYGYKMKSGITEKKMEASKKSFSVKIIQKKN